jgi:N-carbamoylputrescine amidase
MQFWGGSFVTNGQGKLLYLGSHDQEETTVVSINLNETDYFRMHWPFMRDRRIDSYTPITKRFIDED